MAFLADLGAAAASFFSSSGGRALVGLVVSVGLSFVSGLLAPKSKDRRGEAVERGITQLIRASAESHRIVWGERLVSGVMVFADVSGTDNRFLHMVIALTGHQSHEITTVFFNDVGINDDDMDSGGLVTVGRFANKARIVKHLGEDDQVSDAFLTPTITNWTTNHRLRGITYLYVSLDFDRDVYPTGIPNVKALVKGRLIADPRDTAVVITSSSVANPTVITTASTHGRSAKERVFISGHTGATPEIIGEYQVLTTPTTTTYTIDVNVTVGGTGGSQLHMRWSDNAALCLRDYLLASFGLNADQNSEIDDAAAITAANICDEPVLFPTIIDVFNFTASASDNIITQTVPAPARAKFVHPNDGVVVTTSGTLPGGLVNGGTIYFVISVSGKEDPFEFRLALTLVNAIAGVAINITDAGTGTHTLARINQPRYTINGIAALDDDPINIAPPLIAAMGGQLTYTQGKYTMFAGAFNGPATIPTLTESSLRGEIIVRPRPGKADLHNSVRGIFTDRDNKFLRTDFPPRVNSTFVTADKGEKIFKDVELIHVIDTHRAQRLAVLINQRDRQGMLLDYPANLSVLEVAVGDVVDVTNSLLGITDKEFEVLSFTFSEDGGIDLVLKETAAGVYTFNPETDEEILDIAPNTDLPGAFDPPPVPTGLVLTSGTAELLEAGDGTIISRIKVAWTVVPDILVTSGGKIEVQMKKSADSVFDTMPDAQGSEVQVFLASVVDGVAYDVRIRSVNKLGVTSAYATSSNHTVIGKTAVPPDLASFVVATLADGTRKFEWTTSSVPADVRAGGGYQIRFSSGASLTWATGTKLNEGLLLSSPFETSELSAGQFTFGIKAFDSTDNESANDVQITVTLGDPRLKNVIIQRVEHSLLWPGTLTDCFIAPENVLEAVFLGSPSDDWDSLPSTWDALAATWRGIVANATPLRYETPVMDVLVDSTFSPLISVAVVGTATVEMRTHTDAEGSDLSAEAYIAIAQVVSERYIQIRVSVAGTTPVITTMTTLIDGDFSTQDFQDINTATEGGAFFNLIAAGHFEVGTDGTMTAISQAQILAIQSVTVPHTWTLVSKTATVGGNPAAEFKIFDDNGVLANATIDVTIKGPKA